MLAREPGRYVEQTAPRHDTDKGDLMFDLASPGGANNKIRKQRRRMVVRP
jgi:hypothetical protein